MNSPSASGRWMPAEGSYAGIVPGGRVRLALDRSLGEAEQDGAAEDDGQQDDRDAGERGGGEHLADLGLVLAGKFGDRDRDGLRLGAGQDHREEKFVPRFDEGEDRRREER